MGYARWMSTFDPNLEPPGDWQVPYGQPTPQGTNPNGPAAAVWVWVCGAVQILMSGCCALSGLAMMVLDPAEITKTLPPDMPNRDEFVQMVPMLGPTMLIGSLALLFVPALILCILAFWVRRGGKATTITCIVILGIQSMGVALMLLQYLYALFVLQAVAMIIMVVILGLILALFVKTIFELIAVLRSASNTQDYPNGW